MHSVSDVNRNVRNAMKLKSYTPMHDVIQPQIGMCSTKYLFIILLGNEKFHYSRVSAMPPLMLAEIKSQDQRWHGCFSQM